MKKIEIIKKENKMQVVCPNCGNSSKYAEWKNSESMLKVLIYKNNKRIKSNCNLIYCPTCNKSITTEELLDAIKEYEYPNCRTMNSAKNDKLLDYLHTCPNCEKTTSIIRIVAYNLFNGDNEHQELELIDENIKRIDKMVARNDEIDNAVYECICILAEKELDWDMEIIGNATEAIIAELENHDIKVRYPGVTTDEDGRQHYEE